MSCVTRICRHQAAALVSAEVLDEHEIAGELAELNEHHRSFVKTETHAKRSDLGGIRHHLHHRITSRPEVAEPNPRSGRRLIHVVDAVRANGPIAPVPLGWRVEDLLLAATTQRHAPNPGASAFAK
jgi:hypothetical protein